MSRQKRFIGVLATILLLISVVGSFASYASPANDFLSITPRWANVRSTDVKISVSGKTVQPSLYVQCLNSKIKISGTLYLEKKSGASWSSVSSWSVSGTGVLQTSKKYTGVVGSTYRARFVVTAGGEKVEGTSSSCTV